MPLYVVDGVPFSNQNLGSAGTWGGIDMGDGLSNINPDDIESIQVLKVPPHPHCTDTAVVTVRS